MSKSVSALTPLEVVQMVLVVVRDDEQVGSQAVVVENLQNGQILTSNGIHYIKQRPSTV